MRIAVASIDGLSVAPILSGARYLLVFPVAEEEVSVPEVRPLCDDAPPERTSSRVPLDLVAFPSPLYAPDSPQEGVPEGMKLAVLDCDILLAVAFSPQQQLDCRRLGIFALAVPAGVDAELAVRWVVSGAGSHDGASCGDCPSA